MKKNFLLAMVVMLMTAVSSFAQKEYNMVITLSNGTTVTLGHNDIKEITFNDGKVAISGNMVNTIDSLAQVTCDLNAAILENKVYNLDQDNRLQKVAEATDNIINKLATAIDKKHAAYDEALQSISDFVQQQAELNVVFQNNFETIVAYMEHLHPELANSREFKAAKAAVAAARKK